MATSDQLKHWRRRLESLETERKRGWESHWRDLATHFLPRRSRFLDAGERTNDGHRMNRLEDDLGILARRTLSAGMQSGLTSPARPWFSLTLENEAVAHLAGVKEWLHYVYERMVNVFNRSNFYDQMHLQYDELGTFGTGVMLVEEDATSTLRCRTLTVGEYCLDTNAAGRVDTLYRRVRMSARQIAEAWPETAPERIRNMAENDNPEWITVLHLIEPRPGHREGRKDGRGRPWLSVYMLLEGDAGKEVLEESGYFEFPALCPRWNTTASDVYGSSPAMDALGDCRMLQRITRDARLALEKEVDPPLLGSTSGGLKPPVDTSGGAINWVSSLTQGQNALQPLYQVRANLSGAENLRGQLKQQIREMFFNDLFLMINQVDRRMTATEVAERNSEKMLLLGPVLDRLRSELFQPLIERVFGIMSRQSLIPEPPQELQGQEVKIEFISILALAQKQAGLTAIQNTVAFAGQLAQIDPKVADKINLDEAIDEVAAINGVPPKMIRSGEEVEALRAQREQQMQMMQGMQTAQAGAGVAATGAKALKDSGLPPEALAAALGAMGGDGNVPVQ